jgi:hypothetical protein
MVSSRSVCCATNIECTEKLTSTFGQDLHKFSAPLAKIAVKSYLNSILVSRKESCIDSDAVFIVGKGKGSKGEPVLIPTIMRLLTEEYGLKAKMEEKNNGRIRVSVQEMNAFVTKNRWKF